MALHKKHRDFSLVSKPCLASRSQTESTLDVFWGTKTSQHPSWIGAAIEKTIQIKVQDSTLTNLLTGDLREIALGLKE